MKIFDAIEHVNLSCNQINVPSIIGAFENLCDLDLSKNLFQGVIPQSFKQLEGSDQLDLSNKNLSNLIPKFLEALHIFTPSVSTVQCCMSKRKCTTYVVCS